MDWINDKEYKNLRESQLKVENLEIIDELHETRTRFLEASRELSEARKRLAKIEKETNPTIIVMIILLGLLILCGLTNVYVAESREQIQKELQECQSDCQ